MQALMLSRGEELQYFLFFGLLVLFLMLEHLIPRRHPNLSQSKRWLTNAGMTVLIIMTLPLLPLSYITAAFWAEQEGYGLLNNLSFQLPISVLILGTLLARGFISYITHFLNHHVPFLWRFHRVHHMDTELDVSSTVRFHPLEMVFSLIIGLPIVLLLGLTPWVLILYELIDISVVLFSHSNVKIPRWLNDLLRFIIVTPELHKVHHSSFQPETDSNYSAVFPIWDLVFRTYRTKTRQPIEIMPLGLEAVSDEKAQNIGWLLVSPFISLEEVENESINTVSD